MIWVEVLDRRGHVADRTRCDALPATIGRAYGGDVVLDDRHVDPVHARLVREADGTVVLEDAGSLNGIVVGGVRSARVPVVGPTLVHLGQTAVRLVPADAPVAAAVPLPAARRGLMALLTAPRWAALIAVAGFGAAMLVLWLGDPGAKAGRQALGGALAVGAALAAWAGGWALGGRLHGHRPAFLAHFAAAWLAIMALDLAGAVSEAAAFLLDLGGAAIALNAVAGVVTVTALIAVHLALASALDPVRRVVAAVAVVAALAGLGLAIGEAAQGEFGGEQVTIRSSVEPLPASLARARGLDAFLGETDGLRRAVDRLAEQE